MCIVASTSRGRECGEPCREEQLTIFTAAPHEALSVAMKDGIEFLGDIPPRRIPLQEDRFPVPVLRKQR
jgi:hypothetical protein